MYIIHLPFLKDTNEVFGNTWVSGSEPTSSYLVTDSRFGNCYDVNSKPVKVSTNNLQNITEFSCTFWIYLRNNVIYAQWSDIWNISSNPNLRMEFSSSNVATGDVSVNVFNNGAWTGDGGSGSFSVPREEWHFIAISISKTKLRLYMDGVLKIESNKSNQETALSADYFQVGDTGNASSFKICDVRIFNNAISQKDVKDIYKFKVIHYKFNTEFEEPTDNLMSAYNTNIISANNPNLTERLTMTNYVHNTNYDYSFHISVTPGTGDRIRWYFPLEMLTKNTNYAISFDITTSGGVSLRPYNWCDEDFISCKTIVNGMKMHCELVCSKSTDYTDVYRFLDLEPCFTYEDESTLTTGADITITNIMVEKLDHCTYFSKSSRSGKVHDSSSFGNDGEWHVNSNNYPRYSTDSPVNKYSIKFDKSGTDYILAPNPVGEDYTFTEFSISYWIKANNPGKYPIVIGDSGGPTNGLWISYNCESSGVWAYNRGTYYRSSGTLTNGEWHHCVYTFKNGECTSYIDGIKNKTSSYDADHNTIHWTHGTLTIGDRKESNYSWDTTIDGNYADIQMFLRALTQEEALELYKTRASVDNTGNFHVNEINEIRNHYELSPCPQEVSGPGPNGSTKWNSVVENCDESPTGKSLKINVSGAGNGFYFRNILPLKASSTYLKEGDKVLIKFFIKFNKSITVTTDQIAWGVANINKKLIKNNVVANTWSEIVESCEVSSMENATTGAITIYIPVEAGDTVELRDFSLTDYDPVDISSKSIANADSFIEISGSNMSIGKDQSIKSSNISEI